MGENILELICSFLQCNTQMFSLRRVAALGTQLHRTNSNQSAEGRKNKCRLFSVLCAWVNCVPLAWWRLLPSSDLKSRGGGGGGFSTYTIYRAQFIYTNESVHLKRVRVGMHVGDLLAKWLFNGRCNFTMGGTSTIKTATYNATVSWNMPS